MYNSYEEKQKEKYSLKNINEEYFIVFLKLEKECNAHNISEAVNLMRSEEKLSSKDFNKYKRFIKSATKNMTTSWGTKLKPLAWKKEYDYKEKE